MNISNAFAELRGLDATLEKETVPTSRIIPQGGQRVSLDGENYTWSPAAARQIRNKFGITEVLEGKLPSEVVQLMWDALIKHESNQPAKLQRLPSELKVSLQDGHIVGFADASLVTLSNTQVVEALELATEKLPMQEAEVRFIGKPMAATWELRLLFPFRQIQPRRGDIVLGGLTINHSAAGLHGMQVRNYLERLVCTNGSTIPICVNNKQLRIRRRRQDQFADQDVIDKVRQMVTQGVRELDTKLKAIADLEHQKVNAKEMLAQIAQQTRLRRSVTERLLDALNEDEGGTLQGTGTRFDVWNALTRTATHNPAGLLRESGRERLSLYSGCFSQQSIHRCPSCNRILEPSRN